MAGECTGRCLCGAVRYKFIHKTNDVTVCHCLMCRRWASGPFFDVEVGKDITFTGTDHMTVYRSSEWAERAFCKTCGGNLYFRRRFTNQIYVAAGTLDDLSKRTLTTEYFIDEKPAFYDFANDCQKLTGEELFAFHNAEVIVHEDPEGIIEHHKVLR